MAFLFKPEDVEEHRKKHGKPKQEKKYDAEKEKDDERRSRREPTGYDPLSDPKTFKQWLCARGKDSFLHFLRSPLKPNLLAIYSDLKPNTKRDFSPSVGLDGIGVKWTTQKLPVFGIPGSFFERMYKKAKALNPTQQEQVVEHLNALLEPLWAPIGEPYDISWFYPKQLPKTYAAFEAWLRYQLGLPMPHRVRENYQRFQEFLISPEYPL